MKFVSVIGPKGSGKTTVAVNVAACLANEKNLKTGKNNRVLLVDANANCGATEALGYHMFNTEGEELIDSMCSSVMLYNPNFHFLKDIIFGTDHDEPIQELPTLHLIPGHAKLYEEDRKQARYRDVKERKNYGSGWPLSRCLRNSIDIVREYDTMVFDLGSTINQTTFSTMVFSEVILIVMKPTYEDLEVSTALINAYERRLEDEGIDVKRDKEIIVNGYNERRTIDKEVLDILNGKATENSSKYDDLEGLYNNGIPIRKSVRIDEAMEAETPLIVMNEDRYAEVRSDFQKLTRKLAENGLLLE